MLPNEQFAALNILDYISALFTAAGKEHFSREDILVVLNTIKSDPEIFDPDVVIAQEISTAD
jgi:hypothetical protein